MTARRRRHQSLLRVDCFDNRVGNGHRQRRSGGHDFHSTIKRPLMASAIAIVGEFVALALPTYFGFVLMHLSLLSFYRLCLKRYLDLWVPNSAFDRYLFRDSLGVLDTTERQWSCRYPILRKLTSPNGHQLWRRACSGSAFVARRAG